MTTKAPQVVGGVRLTATSTVAFRPRPRSLGQLQRVGVDGTGAYGAGLLRHLRTGRLTPRPTTARALRDRARPTTDLHLELRSEMVTATSAAGAGMDRTGAWLGFGGGGRWIFGLVQAALNEVAPRASALSRPLRPTSEASVASRKGSAHLDGDFLAGVVAVLGQGVTSLPALVPGLVPRLALGAERLGIARPASASSTSRARRSRRRPPRHPARLPC
jgi:hypothetical protein